MRRLTLEQWEGKYNVQGIKARFDSKNGMFNRPIWDPELRSRSKSWAFLGDIMDKPGYALEDQALRWGARRATIITRLKLKSGHPTTNGAVPGPSSVPNPAATSQIAQSGSGVSTMTVRSGTQVSAASADNPAPSITETIMPMTYKPPEGAKIDTSDTQAITRRIKK